MLAIAAGGPSMFPLRRVGHRDAALPALMSSASKVKANCARNISHTFASQPVCYAVNTGRLAHE